MKPKRIIVVGASAGGLRALHLLFAEFDPDLQAAAFVVLHTASDSRYLASVLNRTSRLPVKTAQNGPIESGLIYVAAPDHHLTLESEGIRLIQGPKENRHRPSIDVLFRSAAFTYRQAVIGVVLTGMLDDGTAGLFYVKRYGGITIVQDPNDAEFKSMPLNATNYVQVDHIVPLVEMPSLLNRIVRQDPAPVSTETGVDFSATDQMRQEDAKSGTPTLYVCPECQGPLSELRNSSLQRFRCRAGHAYGLNSLVYSQAETTERILWSALQSLETKAELEKTLLDVAHIKEDPVAYEEYQKRYLDSQRGVKLLEQVLKLSNGEGTMD